MAVKKPRLGRGLDALFDSLQSTPTATPASDKEQLRQVPIDLLQRGKYQPRTHMDEEALQTLADSIKRQGIVQPIVARDLGSGDYEIVAGERRWRAAQRAGLHEVPVIVKQIPDEAAIAIALIENIQRENLNPIEEAQALQRLTDEFKLTHQQIAETVGRSRAAVSNLLRLLALEDEIKRLLEIGKLDMGHARALLSLKEGAERLRLAREIAQRGLSVRDAEKSVQRRLSNAKQKKPAPQRDADIQSLEQALSGKLGTKVDIQHQRGGKGKLVIHYNSADEFDGILSRIR